MDHHFTATTSSFEPLNFGKWARLRVREGERRRGVHTAAACWGLCVINKQSHKISSLPQQFTFSAHLLQTDFIFISVREKCFPVYVLQHCHCRSGAFSFQFVSAHSINLCPTALQCNECRVYSQQLRCITCCDSVYNDMLTCGALR